MINTRVILNPLIVIFKVYSLSMFLLITNGLNQAKNIIIIEINVFPTIIDDRYHLVGAEALSAKIARIGFYAHRLVYNLTATKVD
jgi:hypothetical protein